MIRKLLMGTIALLVIVYVFGGMWLGATQILGTSENPIAKTPGDVGLSYQTVIIESDGFNLPGWWITPAAPRAVLVWAHGGGSNRHSTFFNSVGFYQALHESNIAVLTFDQRDHGEAPKDTGRLTLGRDESRDVAAAVAWARNHTGDKLPLFLMGVSMGGASSIIAIADGLAVDALVLTDPALDNIDVMNQGGWVGSGIPGPLFMSVSWGAALFQDIPIGDRSPLVLGKSLQVPTLLLQSPDDPVTRAPFARELAEANDLITLVEAPAVEPDDPCINFKGRWGSHASAFLCHPEWTMRELNTFFDAVLKPI